MNTDDRSIEIIIVFSLDDSDSTTKGVLMSEAFLSSNDDVSFNKEDLPLLIEYILNVNSSTESMGLLFVDLTDFSVGMRIGIPLGENLVPTNYQIGRIIYEYDRVLNKVGKSLLRIKEGTTKSIGELLQDSINNAHKPSMSHLSVN